MATATVDLAIPFVFATLSLNAIVQLPTMKDAIVLTTKSLTDTTTDSLTMNSITKIVDLVLVNYHNNYFNENGNF